MLDTDFKFNEVNPLLSQISADCSKVQFKNIFNNANGGVALIAFKAGQKLDTHEAPAEIMVNVLEGEVIFTILGKPHIIRTGEFILMGNGVPHRVEAKKDSKVMLVKIRP